MKKNTQNLVLTLPSKIKTKWEISLTFVPSQNKRTLRFMDKIFPKRTIVSFCSDTEIDPLFEDNEKYQNEEDLYVFCEVCKIKLLKACLWKHLRTKRHRKQAGSDAEEYQSDVEIENKKRSGDYIENKEMWNVEVFRNLFLKNPRSIEGYKYEWASFCKLSYYDQQNPPTEEMYIDFIQKKKESGKTDKAIYLIYLRLKKIALHVYGQSLQDFEKFKELIPHHSGLPSIYGRGGN